MVRKGTNALIIGLGSIGYRHLGLLNQLGCNTAVVSRRNTDSLPSFSTLESALKTHNPGYIVVSNVTSEHYTTLVQLSQLGYTGTVLVEKPLFHRCLEFGPHPFRRIWVAYSLRFHPVIQHLRFLLAGEKIISVLAYVGQYLPEWRQGRDYRESYSAIKKEGGGVLRDLSHELDYLLWLLKGWDRVTALGGHWSSLEIDSDDVCAVSMVTPLCPAVTLQMNYLDRMTRRFMVVNTEKHTIEANLSNGTLTVDQMVENFQVDRDTPYMLMHRAALEGDKDSLCSFDEGFNVLRLIDAIECAIEGETWIEK